MPPSFDAIAILISENELDITMVSQLGTMCQDLPCAGLAVVVGAPSSCTEPAGLLRAESMYIVSFHSFAALIIMLPVVEKTCGARWLNQEPQIREHFRICV